MSSKNIYTHHYVYRISNIIENKHYYGVRSCVGPIELDLGLKYFSSSTDKDFLADQKNNPSHYTYKVVQKFNTRYLASERERTLHNLFDVAENERFYNLRKSTSSGYDFTGRRHSIESKTKISNAVTNPSAEIRAKMSKAATGRKHTPGTKAKMSEQRQNPSIKTREKLSKSMSNPSAQTREKMSKSKMGVPKSDETKARMTEAQRNRILSDTALKNIAAGRSGRTNARNKISGEIVCISCQELKNNPDLWESVNVGRVNCFDTIQLKRMTVTTDEFKRNKSLVSVGLKIFKAYVLENNPQEKEALLVLLRAKRN